MNNLRRIFLRMVKKGASNFSWDHFVESTKNAIFLTKTIKIFYLLDWHHADAGVGIGMLALV